MRWLLEGATKAAICNSLAIKPQCNNPSPTPGELDFTMQIPRDRCQRRQSSLIAVDMTRRWSKPHLRPACARSADRPSPELKRMHPRGAITAIQRSHACI